MKPLKTKLHEILSHDFLKKFYSYLVIGIIGVIVDTIVTNIFFNIIFSNLFRPETVVQINTFKTISALLGGFAGIINNFLLNDFFVYKIEGTKVGFWVRFSKYTITIVFGGWLIGKIVILNLASTIGLGLTTANIIAIAVGMLINYPINYFWTWKKK